MYQHRVKMDGPEFEWTDWQTSTRISSALEDVINGAGVTSVIISKDASDGVALLARQVEYRRDPYQAAHDASAYAHDASHDARLLKTKAQHDAAVRAHMAAEQAHHRAAVAAEADGLKPAVATAHRRAAARHTAAVNAHNDQAWRLS